MKKVYLAFLLAASVSWSASAQKSFGGFPESRSLTQVEQQKVDHIQFPKPDYDAIKQRNERRAAKGIPSPYMVLTMVKSDISLANSGTWTYLDDGSKIWRLSVTVPGAKAVSFLYDHFKLPKGVKLFITNANGRQINGAYTAADNDLEFGNFAHQPVQGETANLELDIASGVSTQAIVFHINRVTAYYRGVAELAQAFGDAPKSTAAKPTGVGFGTSAPCNKDANCPLPSIIENDYTIPKKSSIQITIQHASSLDGGFCSGTVINNTGNSQNGTCVPYVLTASHCDETNSYASDSFSQWLFRFNYRKLGCDSGALFDPGGTHTTMVGADFKARSYFPSISTGGQFLSLVGDFILLQLRSTPDVEGGTYLAGWNRRQDLDLDPNYDFYIGFHYPHGDAEKWSYSTGISGNGTFNQNQVSNTHWHTSFAVGGTQPGSSGSGLFDKTGHVIGDLSGGVNSGCDNNPNYADFGKDAEYSKISYTWTNNFDQTHHSAHAGPESRLKDWLDPTNSGADSVGPLMPNCVPINGEGIGSIDQQLNNNIAVYPTPTSGIVHSRMNLKRPENFQIRVYNSLGRVVRTFRLDNAYRGDYTFDCSGLASGLYVMKFVSSRGTASKKMMIVR